MSWTVLRPVSCQASFASVLAVDALVTCGGPVIFVCGFNTVGASRR
jgi:hypothetical protein